MKAGSANFANLITKLVAMIVVHVVVVVEMNIVKMALSHCCCKTTIQC